MVVEELVTSAPSGSDPAAACANARPPTKHSHVFWPDGRFHFYDESESEVDYGRWVLLDDHTVKIGDPPDSTFTFSVTGEDLSLTPIVPSDFSVPNDLFACAEELARGLAA